MERARKTKDSSRSSKQKKKLHKLDNLNANLDKSQQAACDVVVDDVKNINCIDEHIRAGQASPGRAGLILLVSR